MSPMEDIEADLKEAQKMYRRFMGKKVTFLTGANPFVLKYDRLMEIVELVHRYFPEMKAIGSFARVTDVTLKTDEELAALRGAGYDGLTIGIETADDEALRFMDKRYLAAMYLILSLLKQSCQFQAEKPFREHPHPDGVSVRTPRKNGLTRIFRPGRYAAYDCKHPQTRPASFSTVQANGTVPYQGWTSTGL